MDKKEKLLKMEEHLKEHPKDYQTVISYVKTRSDVLEKDIEDERNARRKLLEGVKLNTIKNNIMEVRGSYGEQA